MYAPQPNVNQPPMTTGYAPGPAPERQWGPPVMAQPVGAPPPTPVSARTGHGIVLIGNILIAAGVMVLAFSLATVTVYPDTSGFYSDHWSLGLGAIVFTVGMLLVGIGFLIRSFGIFLTATK